MCMGPIAMAEVRLTQSDTRRDVRRIEVQIHSSPFSRFATSAANTQFLSRPLPLARSAAPWCLYHHFTARCACAPSACHFNWNKLLLFRSEPAAGFVKIIFLSLCNRQHKLQHSDATRPPRAPPANLAPHRKVAFLRACMAILAISVILERAKRVLRADTGEGGGPGNCRVAGGALLGCNHDGAATNAGKSGTQEHYTFWESADVLFSDQSRRAARTTVIGRCTTPTARSIQFIQRRH